MLARESASHVTDPWFPASHGNPKKSEEQEEPRREEDEELGRDQHSPNGQRQENRRRDAASQDQPREQLGLPLLLFDQIGHPSTTQTIRVVPREERRLADPDRETLS